MSITIPTLRSLSISGTVIVPAGEHWHIYSILHNVGTGVQNTTFILSGNSYILYDQTTTAIQTVTRPSRATYLAPRFTMQPGDSVSNSGSTLIIYYWIIETDFNFKNPPVMPALRYAVASQTNFSAAAVVVPSNETWITPVVFFNVKGYDPNPIPPGSYPANINITATITKDTFTLMGWNETATLTVFPEEYATFGGFLNTHKNFILKTGDDLRIIRSGGSISAPAQHTIQVGYWILEQDF